MKNLILQVLTPFFLLGSIFLTLFPGNENPLVEERQIPIALCATPGGTQILAAENGKFIGVMPGWGSYSYKISTANDSAQFYFDQGLNLYYSYHMKESLASFKEAARLDPASAMTYWGQALAMGPYYNGAHTYKMPAEIQQVLNNMNEKVGLTTSKEKSLIEIMNYRYSPDLTDSKRKELNLAYAASMRELTLSFPDDDDIKALYVDAIMLIHAWDFWNSDGSPKPWTEEVVQLCQKILEKNPNHPAALHYHIHLTEASHHPEEALPNADKLKDLFPGVAHMVHMSSHEYQRNGLFAKGVEVNDAADKNLGLYDSLAKNLTLAIHSPHYFAVQTYCAMSGGMYETGMRDALRCRESVAPTAETTYDQYLYMLPSLTLVRLGKWDELLKDNNAPDESWTYASLLDDFAKGMAYVNTGKMELAKQHLTQLQKKAKDPILEKRRIPFNAPLPIALIAGKILEGSIQFKEKNTVKAIASLNEAIKFEDGLIYTEPNDWPIPARQFLGAIYLKMGKPALAENIYKEDLVWNPGNGWSYLGLYKSAEAQKKTKNLTDYKKKYELAFSHAEKIPEGSVFIR
ncbi:hypothetical protein L0657_21570 [Dyadobacter sp. CY345]|uniref:tetratricopeptide repeat protein n=1 Tax=Dyadobacter sp. CY345 TaxID=2909335 RepID=UPI001F3593F7|nr:hypothetical protein [Dyadobacter sp. CY345]MCF2446561.1 hypothetical protein [Dyadobacter sp. CY345]